MNATEMVAVIAFLVLLLAAIFMTFTFYVCDGHTCPIFERASQAGAPGSVPYNVVLLQLYRDGVWPLPYIGAAILTPLALWFIEGRVTVRSFAILFFVSFVVNYFIFLFFGHHYIRPVTEEVIHSLQEEEEEPSFAPLYPHGLGWHAD